MEFVNDTAFQAALFRTGLVDPTRMLGAVVAKATYKLDGRHVVREHEAALPVFHESVFTVSGELPSDFVPWKKTADVLVLGHARCPNGQESPALRVTVSVGDCTMGLLVLGDRTWRRSGGTLDASAPKPFTAMPLDWTRAYGGKATLDGGGDLSHPANPDGKGFVFREADADGTPLPNLEDEEQRIRSWRDQPRPICTAALPIASAIRADDMLEQDARTGAPSRLKEVSHNTAHPRFRVPFIAPGTRVAVTGVSELGAVSFEVPLEDPIVDVWIDDRRHRFETRIDTLGVLPDERRFFVVHRCHFTYAYKAGETRLARLRPSTPDARVGS